MKFNAVFIFQCCTRWWHSLHSYSCHSCTSTMKKKMRMPQQDRWIQFIIWLAPWAGKMELSCLLGTTRHVPQEKFPWKPYSKSFIDQACSVKMAWYWPRSFFASLWTSTLSRFINTQKKNLANIQPSWPHTWSITHTYNSADSRHFFGRKKWDGRSL